MRQIWFFFFNYDVIRGLNDGKDDVIGDINGLVGDFMKVHVGVAEALNFCYLKF
jgi:hypothetical protein